jgi:hypothetical protein
MEPSTGLSSDFKDTELMTAELADERQAKFRSACKVAKRLAGCVLHGAHQDAANCTYSRGPGPGRHTIEAVIDEEQPVLVDIVVAGSGELLVSVMVGGYVGTSRRFNPSTPFEELRVEVLDWLEDEVDEAVSWERFAAMDEQGAFDAIRTPPRSSDVTG